jgi:TP901 family phage tail tape measure protein
MAVSLKFNLDVKTAGADGVKQLSGEIEGLDDVLKRVTSSLKKSTEEMDGFTKLTLRAGQISSFLSQVSSNVDELSANYNSFDKSMRAANTMAGKTGEDFDTLKDKISELSKVVPMARDELANGLYQTISNGVPEDNWIEFLEQTAKASVGGIADLGQAVTVTSTIIKNYGLDWSDAGAIQDKIQKTAQNGVTSFEQLAAALPRVSGNAATLGVSIDELMATFATLTGVSGNTAEVSTQLAAIFTALVKPSSEATKMAAAMGVEFDAAAVKASGGFQQFLTNLDSTIKQYAAANNMLSDEIFGKLFGSAESLRALTPLTGQLAAKYQENVGAMADSTGAINDAFDQMSSTAESKAQIMQNALASITDGIGEIASAYGPQIQFVAIIGQLTNGIASVGSVVGNITSKYISWTVSVWGNITALISQTRATSLQATMNALLSKSFVGLKAVGVACFKAIKVALVSSGIGLLIYGITEAFSWFSEKTDEASESVKELTTTERMLADAQQKQQDIEATGEQVAASALAKINEEARALKTLMDAHKDTASAVEHLNSTYGSIFGTFKTAAQWYDVLTQKATQYALMEGMKSKITDLGKELATVTLDHNKKYRQVKKWEVWGVDKNTNFQEATTSRGEKFYMPEEDYRRAHGFGNQDYDEVAKRAKAQNITRHEAANQMVQERIDAKYQDYIKRKQDLFDEQYQAESNLITSLQNQITDISSQVAETAKSLMSGVEVKTPTPTQTPKPTHTTSVAAKELTEIAAPKTKKDYEQNIKYYDQELAKITAADGERASALGKSKKAAEDAIKALDGLSEVKAPAPDIDAIKTEKEMSTALEYYNELVSESTGAEKAKAAATVNYLNGVKALDDRLSDLNQNQSDANKVFDTYKDKVNILATEYNALADRIGGNPVKVSVDNKSGQDLMKLIMLVTQARESFSIDDSNYKEINALLTNLQRILGRFNQALSAPTDTSKLETEDELNQALSYYNEQLSKTTGAEREANAVAILGLQSRIDKLKKLYDLTDLLTDAESLKNLSDKEFKIEAKEEGFDQIQKKIRLLNKTLTDDKITPELRARTQAALKTYQELAINSVDTFDTMKSAWGTFKGLGDGIRSMTDTIQGDGDAWEKTGAVVDGVIGIYERVAEVIKLVNLMSTLLGISKKKEMAETVAGASTTVAAKGAETAAVTTEANAEVEGAAAKAMNAHAGIPFVGIAMGAAMVAMMLATMLSLPKFAEGGIAYGPTLGLFGEYAGASNNPEVVAPLNKLRALIEPNNGLNGGRVVFKIEGRTLVGVLEKTQKLSSRS